MTERVTRIAIIGHFTYFENHFPEGWAKDPDVLCLDVNEKDYSWLLIVNNFCPDITLFFRPELYPRHYIERIPGLRIAILSEPLPELRDGQLDYTDETRLRKQVYGNMAWDAYHWRIFYDKGKEESAKFLGFPIDEYRPLPIDTSQFHDSLCQKDRLFDVTFIGKPTPHRISKLDFLRSSAVHFLWIAHGLSGGRLAEVFRRSKVVLNVHADGQMAFEPRLYLAAACGARVITEPISSTPAFFAERIWEHDGDWNEQMVMEYLYRAGIENHSQRFPGEDLDALSTRKLINDLLRRFIT